MTPRTDISSILVFGAAVGLAACAQPRDPRAERQALLDRIAAACGLPGSAFLLTDANEVRFRPPPESRYGSVDCALTKLRDNRLLRDAAVGFVGNEAVRPEGGNEAR